MIASLNWDFEFAVAVCAPRCAFARDCDLNLVLLCACEFASGFAGFCGLMFPLLWFTWLCFACAFVL